MHSEAAAVAAAVARCGDGEWPAGDVPRSGGCLGRMSLEEEIALIIVELLVAHVQYAKDLTQVAVKGLDTADKVDTPQRAIAVGHAHDYNS